MTSDVPYSLVELKRMAESFDIQPNGCWNWNKQLDHHGYGIARVSNPTRKSVRAHRYMYAIVRGQEVPKELVCDHLCRNTSCVNPYHIEAVTQRVNTLRGFGPTAMMARKTHCWRGHPFDTVNTYTPPGGGRVCRACVRATNKAWKAKQRALAKVTQVIDGREGV